MTEERFHEDLETVLIFSTVVLPYSQTFILDHASSLKRYQPIIVGFKNIEGINLGDQRTSLIATNSLSRWKLYWFGRSKSLDKLIQQTGAKLIHCHFADAGALITRYCKRRRLPLIVTIHGSDVLRKRHRSFLDGWRTRLFQEGLRGATRFLPVSDWLLSQSAKAGVPMSLMQRHYLGIPLEAAPKKEDGATDPVILFVGRLVEKKGLVYLLDAIRILTEQGERFQVRIAGGGPLRKIAEARVLHQRLPVTFSGIISPTQVRSEMDRADIFCMPSTSAADGDNEGLGLVFIEAQSRRLPVVSFNQGPIPEAVENGLSGLLVEDKNTVALADALAALIRDPSMRRRMGDEGRRLVQTRFDNCEQTRKLEIIYDEILRRE